MKQLPKKNTKDAQKPSAKLISQNFLNMKQPIILLAQKSLLAWQVFVKFNFELCYTQEKGIRARPKLLVVIKECQKAQVLRKHWGHSTKPIHFWVWLVLGPRAKISKLKAGK